MFVYIGKNADNVFLFKSAKFAFPFFKIVKSLTFYFLNFSAAAVSKRNQAVTGKAKLDLYFLLKPSGDKQTKNISFAYRQMLKNQFTRWFFGRKTPKINTFSN